MCDNECEGCEKTPGCILLELNECQEEKVEGRLAGSSGLLSNDEWGKASGRSSEEASALELGPLPGALGAQQ